MIPPQFPIQENQIGDFYLLNSGGDTVIDSKLDTAAVTLRKINIFSNGSIINIENLGTGFDLVTTNNKFTMSKSGEIINQTLTANSGEITTLISNNIIVLNNLTILGNLNLSILNVATVNVSNLANLKNLTLASISTFNGSSTFNGFIVNAPTTFNSQVIINEVLNDSLLIKGNTIDQLGIKVSNQKFVLNPGAAFLKLESSANLTSYPYIEFVRAGSLAYRQRFAIGSNLSYEFVVNTAANYTSQFINEITGTHNVLVNGTFQIGGSTGPILSGDSIALSISKNTQILGGLFLGDITSTGFIKQPSLFGNPSLQIVARQSTPFSSALINSFNSALNSGIAFGTTQSDGIAFRVANNIGLTTGLPSSNGTDRFIVFGNGGVSVGTSNNPGVGNLVASNIQLGSTESPILSGDNLSLISTKNSAENIFQLISNFSSRLRLRDLAALVNENYFEMVSDDNSLTFNSLYDNTAIRYEILKVLGSTGNTRVLTGLEMTSSNLVLTGVTNSLRLNSKLIFQVSSSIAAFIKANTSSTSVLTVQNTGNGFVTQLLKGNLEIYPVSSTGGELVASGVMVVPAITFDKKAESFFTASGARPNLYAKKRNTAGIPPHLLTYWDRQSDSDVTVSLGTAPIGSISAWHKSLPNTPSLPENWVECNGGVVTDERSPLQGQLIPDLNNPPVATPWATAGSFIRGSGSSNATQVADKFQGHKHITHLDTASRGSGGGFQPLFPPGTVGGGGDVMTHTYASDGSNGTPRTGKETYPIHVKMVWVMRIF